MGKQKTERNNTSHFTVEYFQSRLDKLSQHKAPVPSWIIHHIAEVGIQLIDSARYRIAQLLESFILTQTTHYARCGLYVIDAMCNSLFSRNPESSALSHRTLEINVHKLMSAFDEMLPRLFYSFIKREKHRIIQIKPLDESTIRLTSNNQLWIKKLLRRWYQHHFFRDNTILYISEKLHLPKPTRELRIKRKWKDFDPIVPPKKKIKNAHNKELKPVIHLQELPVEIILRIFSYLEAKQLATVAMTNSLFYQVSRDKSLWKHLHIRQQERVSLRMFLQWTKGCWGQIESLEVPYCKQVDDEMVKLFAENFYSLKRINLQGCSEIHDVNNVISLISANAPHVTHLDLSFLYFDQMDSSITFSDCKHLQCLSVADLRLFDKEMMINTINHCKSLLYLDISCCTWLVVSLLYADWQVETKSLNTLQFYLSSSVIKLQRDHAEYIIEKLPSLQTLCMYFEDASENPITVNGVQIHSYDSRIAIAHDNEVLLQHLISTNPNELLLHDIGGISLLGMAIERGNIKIIEYLCSQNIPIANILEKKIKQMLGIAKKILWRSGIPKKIEKTKENANDFEFLLRLILELTKGGKNAALIQYCGTLVDIFSSSLSFISWTFSKANTTRRDFISTFCKWENSSTVHAYVKPSTIRDIKLAATGVDIM